MATKTQALECISKIREIQDLKHGYDHHNLPDWFIITRRQLQKAEDEWYNGKRSAALNRMAHVGACACASIEQNGDIE